MPTADDDDYDLGMMFRPTRVIPQFHARYDGKCAACGERFEQDDMVGFVEKDEEIRAQVSILMDQYGPRAVVDTAVALAIELASLHVEFPSPAHITYQSLPVKKEEK